MPSEEPFSLTPEDQKALDEELREAYALGEEPYCFRCKKPASAFAIYREGAKANGLPSARDYVYEEEGTYNDVTNHFACDECYIAIGMPSSPRGWVAP